MPAGIFIVSFCLRSLSLRRPICRCLCFSVSQLLAYYLCSAVRWTSQVKSEMEILKNRLRTIFVFTCSSHQRRRRRRQRQWQRNSFYYFYFIPLHMSEAVAFADVGRASIRLRALFFFWKCVRATFAASATATAAVDNKKMNVAHLTCHFIVSAFLFLLHFHCLPHCIVRHSRRVCDCCFEARWMK